MDKIRKTPQQVAVGDVIIGYQTRTGSVSIGSFAEHTVSRIGLNEDTKCLEYYSSEGYYISAAKKRFFFIKGTPVYAEYKALLSEIEKEMCYESNS